MGINMCVWRMRLHFSRYRTIRTFPSPPPAAYMSNTRFPYPKHIPPPPHPSLYTHMWAYIHMYRYIHVPERSVSATIQLPGDHPAHSRAPSWSPLTTLHRLCLLPFAVRPPTACFCSICTCPRPSPHGETTSPPTERRWHRNNPLPSSLLISEKSAPKFSSQLQFTTLM